MMSKAHSFSPIKPIQYALGIRKVNSQSWWVYRYQMGRDGILSPIARVVFYSTKLEVAKNWVERQQQEQSVYVLSNN